MCVKLNLLFDRAMKVYYATQVLKQNYILKLRKTRSLKIMSVKLLVIVFIFFKHYPMTYCLMQGSCAICSNFYNLKKNRSKLESQPLSCDACVCFQIVYRRTNSYKTYPSPFCMM